MSDLESAVIEWLEGERLGISRKQMLAEIKHVGQLWPKATANQWNEAIDAVLKQSSITETDGLLRIAEQG